MSGNDSEQRKTACRGPPLEVFQLCLDPRRVTCEHLERHSLGFKELEVAKTWRAADSLEELMLHARRAQSAPTCAAHSKTWQLDKANGKKELRKGLRLIHGFPSFWSVWLRKLFLMGIALPCPRLRSVVGHSAAAKM